jgi:hypothetical protein
MRPLKRAGREPVRCLSCPIRRQADAGYNRIDLHANAGNPLPFDQATPQGTRSGLPAFAGMTGELPD